MSWTSVAAGVGALIVLIIVIRAVLAEGSRVRNMQSRSSSSSPSVSHIYCEEGLGKRPREDRLTQQ